MNRINEIFNCIQGEGKTMGQNRLLIRMNGCNLKCDFCDTKYTWGFGDSHIDLSMHEDELKNHKYWMITGGEPLLPENQKVVLELINKYNPDWVEIETNGTIKDINPELLKRVDLFNISPKEQIDQLEVVDTWPEILDIRNRLKDYILKFVISNKEERINNTFKYINEIRNKYKIEKEKIWLMPISLFNEKEDNIIRKKIYKIALLNNYNFSLRLHVVMFNNKRIA